MVRERREVEGGLRRAGSQRWEKVAEIYTEHAHATFNFPFHPLKKSTDALFPEMATEKGMRTQQMSESDCGKE